MLDASVKRQPVTKDNSEQKGDHDQAINQRHKKFTSK